MNESIGYDLCTEAYSFIFCDGRCTDITPFVSELLCLPIWLYVDTFLAVLHGMLALFELIEDCVSWCLEEELFLWWVFIVVMGVIFTIYVVPALATKEPEKEDIQREKKHCALSKEDDDKDKCDDTIEENDTSEVSHDNKEDDKAEHRDECDDAEHRDECDDAEHRDECDDAEHPENNLCCICWDQKKTIVCQPCGHLCICKSCKHVQKMAPCPICRSKVTALQRIFT